MAAQAIRPLCHLGFADSQLLLQAAIGSDDLCIDSGSTLCKLQCPFFSHSSFRTLLLILGSAVQQDTSLPSHGHDTVIMTVQAVWILKGGVASHSSRQCA